MKKSLIIIFVTFLSLSLSAQTKAKYYENYLKNNPFKYVENDLPKLSDLENSQINLDFVKVHQGYYIQNQKRWVQEKNRSTNIFKLSVEAKKVYLAEIDVKNGKEVVLRQNELKNNSSTFQNEDFTLKQKDGNLYIFALFKDDGWTSEYPFTYQTDLNGLLDCSQIMKMTTDYLKAFAGRYELESFVMNSTGTDYSRVKAPAAYIDIAYDENKKALVTSSIAFIETGFSEPYYWTLAEGAGFDENIYTFADGGILSVQRSNYSSCSDDEYTFSEFYGFYKKN